MLNKAKKLLAETQKSPVLGRLGVLGGVVGRVVLSVLREGLYLLSRRIAYVRGQLSEVRSFLGHICTRRERNFPRNAIDLGPILQEEPGSGCLVRCIRTQARIDCIQTLSARYPWVSEIDILLALDAWDMGAKFSQCSAGTEDMGVGTYRADFTPPGAALQLSRRDL
jgi:hypothetical protein